MGIGERASGAVKAVKQAAWESHAAILFTWLGLLIILSEVARYQFSVWQPVAIKPLCGDEGPARYAVSVWMVAIGSASLYIGGYFRNSAKAKDILATVVGSGVTILGAIPNFLGRRWTDRAAAQVASGQPVAVPPGGVGAPAPAAEPPAADPTAQDGAEGPEPPDVPAGSASAPEER